MKEQEIRIRLAEKLREFRVRAKLTAKEVGVRIGKSDKTVLGWEHGHGQPDADALFLLCEVFGIDSIAEFFEEPMQKESASLADDDVELLNLYHSLNAQARTILMETARAFAGNPAMQKDGVASRAI